MSLAQYSFDNKKVIYFFLAVLLIGGVMAFGKLGKKEDSPFVIKTVVLITQYPGATPLEVEKLITEPIEREIQSMRLVKQIKSESRYGISKINLDFVSSTPASLIPQLFDELRKKVANIQPSLPEGAGTIQVNDDFGDVYGIYYGLTASQGFSSQELRDIAQSIKTELVTVPNVTKVGLQGEQTPVVNLKVSIAKLTALGVTPAYLSQILSSQNKIVSSGDRLAGEMQIKIIADGTFKTLDDIKRQVIVTGSGEKLRLGDVAELEFGYVDPPSTIMRVNGNPAIGIGISTDPEKDVVKVGYLVEERLASIIERLPNGVDLVSLYPENVIAENANNGFIINLIESVLIVVLIIMLVMGFRAGILIGSSLLFCIGGTLLIMQLFNVGLNRTSLAGFIIAMGMLVDNAIVVTDNAQISMQKGVSKVKSLIDGATVPQWGLLGATVIAVISFLPMYLAPSSVAEIVQPLFIVLAISLGLSWVLALSQTVTFGNLILKKPTESGDPYKSGFYNGFAKIISAMINKRWITLTGAVAALMLSFYILSVMPSSFFPFMDKPFFRADINMPDGYNIHQMEKIASKIEAEFLNKKDVKTVSVTIGSSPLRYYLASASFGPKPSYMNVLVELENTDSTAVYEAHFDRWVRASFPDILCQSSMFKLSPVPDALIEIGFIGHDIDTLRHLTHQVENIMRKRTDIQDVRNSWGYLVPQWMPIYSQEKAQPIGVTRQNMAQTIQVATSGMVIGGLRQGDQNLPILLKDSQIEDYNLSNLKTLPVFVDNGRSVLLEQVVDSFDFSMQYGNYKRMNRERIMFAQCDPKRGANTNIAFKGILKEVQETVKVPSGYTLKYLGEQDSQDESNAALMIYLPVTFLMIFVILLLLFKTYLKPIVIMLMLPLIFIGVVFGLFIFGKSLDFFATLGLLGLIGMNIKNAIVLVDQIDIEIAGGLSKYDAVVQATKSRIVPVSMASGTTILGMIPLLFDSMFGGMAATIMGGLLVASLLTLFVLPVTYCTLHRIYRNK